MSSSSSLRGKQFVMHFPPRSSFVLRCDGALLLLCGTLCAKRGGYRWGRGRVEKGLWTSSFFSICWVFLVCFVCLFSFFLFTDTSTASGNSQARGPIGAAAADLRHSHRAWGLLQPRERHVGCKAGCGTRLSGYEESLS